MRLTSYRYTMTGLYFSMFDRYTRRAICHGAKLCTFRTPIEIRSGTSSFLAAKSAAIPQGSGRETCVMQSNFTSAKTTLQEAVASRIWRTVMRGMVRFCDSFFGRIFLIRGTKFADVSATIDTVLRLFARFSWIQLQKNN